MSVLQLMRSEKKQHLSVGSTQLNKQNNRQLMFCQKCVFMCMSEHIVVVRGHLNILSYNIPQISPVFSLTTIQFLDYPKDLEVSISSLSQDPTYFNVLVSIFTCLSIPMCSMRVNVYVRAVHMCMCVQHLAVTLSPTKRVVHGGGYQQCKSLSVIMGGLMTHCHLFDAQHHIAYVFLLLWEEVKAQIIKVRKENRTRLLTIHNRLQGDEGI